MRTHSTTGLALALAIGLAACDDASTSPDTLDAEITATAAAAVADAVLEDLSVMDGTLPSGPQGAPMAGPRSHLVRERTVTFFDAGGAEQDAYDPLTTASIHSVLSLEGEISREGFSASIERSRDLWVTGLEGEETTRTWNGTGSEEHSRSRVSDEFGERSFELEGSSLIEDVVRAVDRSIQPWPLSGRITRTVEVTIVNGPNGDVTRERTVVITFDGTQFAKLTVDGEEFEVDLAARDGGRALRRRGG